MTHASRSRSKSSVIEDAQKVEIARAMVSFGARLQIIVLETGLGRDRLSRLYREIHGHHSLSKGLLPFAEEWYTSWLNNMHSSCFYAYFEQVIENYPEQPRSWHLVQAYTLYTQSELARRDMMKGEKALLSFTRAWVLTRLVSAGALQMHDCEKCSVPFIARTEGYEGDLVCKVCNPPKRSKNSILCQHAHDEDTNDHVSHAPVILTQRPPRPAIVFKPLQEGSGPAFVPSTLPLFPLEALTH